MSRSILAAVTISLALAQPAAAQVYVSGGAFANILRFGGYSSGTPMIYDENLSGRSTGALVGVGGLIMAHGVVVAEFAVAEQIHTDVAPTRYLPPTVPPQYISVKSVDYRTKQFSILAGYRTTEKHRVQASVLGGIMFIHEYARTLNTYQAPPPPYATPYDTASRREQIAPVFGLDVAWAVTRRFAIVPQARLYRSYASVGNGVIGIRPGVSARWTF